MENDGRSGVHFANSLDYDEWTSAVRKNVLGRAVAGSEIRPGVLVKERQDEDGVDIVLTNPPFAGAIKTASTLRQYQLARDDNGKFKKEVDRAKLFLERCIDMLKPGGRLGIVLPQGIFNNINDQEVRAFVGGKCRVLAVVGLHQFTFKPFTLAKTSILFLQKWPTGKRPKDYSVFTAVSLRPGKTKLGRAKYLDDGITLDCDMDEISDAFLKWARKEGLSFVSD
jgi:type I restriction enzyme M protein